MMARMQSWLSRTCTGKKTTKHTESMGASGKRDRLQDGKVGEAATAATAVLVLRETMPVTSERGVTSHGDLAFSPCTRRSRRAVSLETPFMFLHLRTAAPPPPHPRGSVKCLGA